MLLRQRTLNGDPAPQSELFAAASQRREERAPQGSGRKERAGKGGPREGWGARNRGLLFGVISAILLVSAALLSV